MELLSPAGNLESLIAAVKAGADSIYLGLKEFSARAFATNFSIKQLPSVVSFLKDNNIKLYIALNTLIKEIEINKLFKILHLFSKLDIDALIIQDFAIVNIVQQYFPTLKLHSSTQMSNINSYDIYFLEKYNFKRVILDRQLTFDEIKKIKEKSNIELEIFIHGALCYSFAGQCFFSSFLGGQSANRGRCTQPCRRLYILNKQKKGYFFSPNDLSSIEHFEKILSLNLDSLKIEGRMKTEQYVYNVTRAYRILIDEFKEKNKLSKESKNNAKELIKKSFGRKTTSGIYFNSQNIVEPNLSGGTGIFLGKTIATSDKFIIFKTINELTINDRIRIQEPGKSLRISKIIVKDKVKNRAQKGDTVKIPLNEKIKIKKNWLVFKVSSNVKTFTIPDILKKTKKIELNEKILPPLKDSEKTKSEIYLKLRNIKDIQSFADNIKENLIVPLPLEYELLSVKRKLLRLKKNIIIEVPTFIIEDEILKIETGLKRLINSGIDKFLINSKSHFEFFNKFKNIFLILSERFHIANSFSAEFFIKQNSVKRFLLDIENDRDNLKNFKLKNNAIVTLFSNITLLTSRIDNKLKSGSVLFDSKNNKFTIMRKKKFINIFSNENFNIYQYKKDLEKLGYNKFLFDISNIKYYKTSAKEFYNKLKSGKLITGKDFNYNFGWE